MEHWITCTKCGCLFKHAGTRGPKPKTCLQCSKGKTIKQVIVAKAKYSWSKYDTSKLRQLSESDDDWTCQACGASQHKSLPAYLVPLDSRNDEYFKICSNCYREKVRMKLTSMAQIISVVRRFRD